MLYSNLSPLQHTVIALRSNLENRKLFQVWQFTVKIYNDRISIRSSIIDLPVTRTFYAYCYRQNFTICGIAFQPKHKFILVRIC